jgi:hypothetical protein
MSFLSFVVNLPSKLGSALSANSLPVVIASDQTVPVADTNSAPSPGRIALTVGTPGTAGRVFCAICTAAGNVTVTFSNASSGTYPLNVGINTFPWAITEVNSATATATYENWI